jgi:sugar/nucleoside kinase (ribokinase family)
VERRKVARPTLRLDPELSKRLLVGVGGIGTGLFFALEGDHTLGRNESRLGRLLDVRDYGKLHITAHYVAVLLGADPAARGFSVVPVGKVGADAAGRRMRDEMVAVGMDVHFVETDPSRPTLLSVCFQYPDGSGGNITTSHAAAWSLQPADVDRAEPLLAANAGRCIVLAAPEVPLDARHRLLELGTRHGAFRAACFGSAEVAAARQRGMFALVDLLAINEDEAAALVGRAFDPADPHPFLDACGAVAGTLQPGMSVILSVGKEGAYGFSAGAWDHCPAPRVRVASTAGGGDALLGGVLAALAAGSPLVVPGPPRAAISDRPLASALEFGVLLASLTVTSPHTIHPHADVQSLLEFAGTLGAPFSGSLKACLGL